jgi:hypothetical protein
MKVGGQDECALAAVDDDNRQRHTTGEWWLRETHPGNPCLG